MKQLIVLAPVVTLLFALNTVYADRTIWYIHPDSALNTIQAGLDSCANNDIVLVGPGTYVENVDWPNTQGIHLISEMGAEMTVLDGNSDGPVIACTTQVDTTTIIYGFTIQNGWTFTSGAGVSCWNSSPTIMENIIINNIAGPDFYGGGGIFIYNGSPLIFNNLITDNEAIVGGGISALDSIANTIAIIGNTITNNYAYGHAHGPLPGSAIYSRYCNMTVLKNNVISGNYGGTDCICCGAVIIDSCTISNNSSNDGPGVMCLDSSTIHYCNISGNELGVSTTAFVNAEYNWWGHASGPYHPDSNPGGQGDTVGDNVDFIPWLDQPVGVWEQTTIIPANKPLPIGATIFTGPLLLPEGKQCKVIDITGRVVIPQNIKPGIYFIEVEGKITQKVIKVR